MPFWLHESRATLLFKGMPQGYKLSFTLLLSFLPLFIWFVIWYIPTQHTMSKLEREQAAQEQQVKALQKNALRYDQALLKRDELLTTLNVHAFTTASLQDVVDAILGCMHQAAIVCRGIQQNDHAVKEFFTEYRFVVEGKGGFGNILAFIENIQQLPICLVCESIILEESKEQIVRCRLVVRVDVEHETQGQKLIVPVFQGSSCYASVRNPFVMQADSKRQRHDTIMLEGIVASGKGLSAALMAYGSERDIVTQGDTFHGYRLITVDKNFVVVAKGNVTKKLIIE